MTTRSGCAFCIYFVLSMIILATLSLAQTQTYGTVSGTIQDPSGGVVPGAKVTATNKATGQTETSVTNGDGRYVLSNLPTGTYDVAAEKEGFARCVNAGVILNPASSVQLICQVKVGATTETVTVAAQALSVQTEDPKVSRVITDTQMQEMPVNGRNFASLLALQPGVQTEFAFNSFQSMNIFATEGTHVNGLRGDENNVQIDGSPSTRTRANGATTAAPSMDAIGEINIVTSGYMPEYARAGGGQLIVQMKSGTQNYHGSAFEYLRNDALDGRNFFARPPSPKNILKYNNFGYSFGGPVIPGKNKLFFYWAQEWTRLRTSYTNVATVPDALARQGNFTDYCAAALSCPVVPAYLNGVGGLVAGQPFPNNTIPQALWSSNGAAFVSVMAPPNQSGISNNNIQQIPAPQNNRTESIKVDAQFDSIKSHLAVSLRHYRSDWFDGGFAGSSRLENWNIQLPERGGTIDFTTTFSPTLLNDFSFTSTEDIVHVLLPSGPGLNRTALGINFPFIFGDISKDIAGKTPTIQVSGFDTVNGSTNAYPSGSIGHVWQWQDIVTKTHKQHVFKFGVWVERDGEDDYDQLSIGGTEPPNLNGSFDFGASASQNPATTGAPLADVFLGNFDVYQELGFRNRTPWVGNQIGFFGQDTWKVTPKLTFSGGLRWDYYAPYHSKLCNFSMFDPFFYSHAPGQQQVIDPATGFIVGGNPFNGVAAPCNGLPNSAIGHFGVYGEPVTPATIGSINQRLINDGIVRGLPPEILPKHYRNFQPRFGFAYDPAGNGKMSIRGSAGIFYNHLTLNDSSGALFGKNVPFQTAAQIFGGNSDCPGAPLSTTRACAGVVTPSTAAPLPIPISAGDLTGDIPLVYQWSTSVQRMLPSETLLEVGYVGTRGRHLALNYDLNQFPLGVLPTLEARFPSDPSGNVAAAFAPYPGFGRLIAGLNNTTSQYDSLQISAQHRGNKGLQFGVSYTYSKAHDFGSNRYATAVDTYDLRYNSGPPDWQRNHLFTANFVYELPWLRHTTSFAGKALGGWELAGVLALASGSPFNITADTDAAIVGNDFSQNASLVSGCDPNSGPRTINQWFKTACFVAPTDGMFGNAGRNSVWGPPTKNFDLAVYKNGPIYDEKLRYQFRAEFFNVLNHPSFNNLSAGISSGSFGTITGANDPREIQFALRLLF